MPSISALFLTSLAAQAAVAPPRAMPPIVVAHAVPAQGSVAPDSAWQAPGREQDSRVARIVYRLATAGRSRCPAIEPATGLVLQHLAQFRTADRPGMIAALALDRGPAVIAVVPGSPAAIAGIRVRDVLLAVDGVALPEDNGVSSPFDAARAHARADAIADRLARATPMALTLLRDGAVRTIRIDPVPACPARVDLARSGQRNAYADGRHVSLTTGLVSDARSDDELAFIVAHEMAHNILGHAAIMRGTTVKHGLGHTLGQSGAVVRGTERAADALGSELMIDAGYDPVAGAAILRRLGGADFGLHLFATHDSAAQRIAAIRAIVAARAAP